MNSISPTNNSPQLVKNISADDKSEFDVAGCYAFCWIGDKELLKRAVLHKYVHGKKNNEKQEPHKITHSTSEDITLPVCLYISKSTNIKKRFSPHIPSSAPENKYEFEAHDSVPKRQTTACQLRYGIDGLFRNDKNTLDILTENVGFIYEEIDSVKDRFYKENEYIGYYKP